MAETEQVEIAVYCTCDDLMDVADLKPNPQNPNTHPDEQVDRLAKLILRHGWRHPITVSRRSGLVVAGHCRLMAAQKLGCEKVPVDFQDFESEAMEWAVLASDNIVGELSVTDGQLMAEGIVMMDQLNLDVAELLALSEAKVREYVDGPQFEPVDENPRLDVLDPKMVKCPECEHEFDARGNEA